MSETLRQFGRLLDEAGLHEWFAAYEDRADRSQVRGIDASPLPEPLQTVVRLFALGEPVESAHAASQLSPPLLAALESHGLLQRSGATVAAGEYRLASHLGLYLFCHAVSPTAKLYYGNDSLALSRALLPVEGQVLDLCAGAGAQTLVCARTAASVTAVDVEPLAREVFRINAALNGLEGTRVEYLIGDFLEPVAGRRFDRVCSNPPFMPVPPGIRFPVYAAGGPDGLGMVRRLLAALPDVLAPGGRCDVVGAVLGDDSGPELSPFEAAAEHASLAIEISCPSSEPLGDSMLASCAATALAAENAAQLFREHFERYGATRLYYYLLKAACAPRPSLYYACGEVQRVTIGAGRAT